MPTLSQGSHQPLLSKQLALCCHCGSHGENESHTSPAFQDTKPFSGKGLQSLFPANECVLDEQGLFVCLLVCSFRHTENTVLP